MSTRLRFSGSLPRFALTLLLSYSLLFGLLLYFGEAYCRLLQPFFAFQADLFAPPDSELTFSCASAQKLGPELRYEIFYPRMTPDGETGLRKLMGGVKLLPLMQNIAVLAAIILAWPGLGYKKRFFLFVLSLCVMHTVYVFDAPLVFMCDPLPAADVREHFLHLWKSFSENGGRIVLIIGVYALFFVLLLRNTQHNNHQK